MKISNQKYSVLVALVVLSTFVISCENKEKKIKNQEKEKICLSKAELQELNSLTVTNSKVVQKLRLNGKVAYNPNAVVNYVSLVGGIITNTYFTLGDKVKKGQVLAEIKSTELNAIEAEVNQLKAKIKVAKRHLESTQSFYDDGIASDKELMSAESEKENLQYDLHRLQTNLELYSASHDKGIFQIKAPRSGFVVDNKISAGLQIRAEGDPLFTISDLDEVWVNVNIYATNISFVKEGMPVRIKTNSYPDKVFKAKIERISQVIDPNENVLKARIVLDNKDLFLKPGLHVEAIVENEKDFKAPRLPAEAVIFHNNNYYAVVINDCNTTNRPIEVLFQDENSVYIKNGLKSGEKVATKNALLQFENIASAE